MTPTQVAELVTGLSFVFWYSGFIVLFALGSGAIFWFRARSVHRDLRAAKAAILDGQENGRSPKEARASLAKRWSEVDKKLPQIPSLNHAWGEFVECLIIPSLDERQGGRPVRNTRDPAHYFTHDTVIAPSLNLRYLDAVPGLLTGLGILGTFLGLAAGIYLAQEGLTQESIDDVQVALQQLLAGAALAFFTSIAGLLTSLLFLIFERLKVQSLVRRLSSWSHALDRALERTTPEKVAVAQLEEQRQQTAELKTFNTDLAVSIASALDEKIAGRLGPALDRLVEATEAMQEEQSTASEAMLDHVVGRFEETMSGAAGAEMEALAESIRGLDGLLQNSVNAMQTQQAQSSEAMQHLAEQVAETLAEGSSRMRADFQDSFEHMVARLKDVTDAAADSAQTNAARLGREIGASITEAGTALEKAGTAASDRIDQSTSDLADAASGLRGAVEQASGVLVSMTESAGHVRQAANGLAEVIASIREISPSLQSSSSAIRGAGDSISKASTTIQGFGSAATKASQDMAEANSSMQENWARYVDRFEGADEAFASVVQQIESGLTTFVERVTEFNRTIDSEFSRSIQMLTSVIEELDQTLDERAR